MRRRAPCFHPRTSHCGRLLGCRRWSISPSSPSSAPSPSCDDAAFEITRPQGGGGLSLSACSSPSGFTSSPASSGPATGDPTMAQGYVEKRRNLWCGVCCGVWCGVWCGVYCACCGRVLIHTGTSLSFFPRFAAGSGSSCGVFGWASLTALTAKRHKRKRVCEAPQEAVPFTCGGVEAV
jgi:hypothetical protein